MTESEFTRFVIFLTVVPNSESSELLIRNHVAYLKKLDQEGKFVLGGPFTDHRGGMLIVKAKDKVEATAIAQADPFVKENVRTFEVRALELSCEENNHLGKG